MKPVAVDLGSRGHKANPYPFYARLRDEQPVCPVALPGGQEAWLVTRYDDVAAALKDPRLAKDRWRVLDATELAKQPWVPKVFRPLARNMLDVDPPDHTRLRALVQKAFTPRRVESVRDRVRELAERRLSLVAGRGRMDLIADYALPIPTTIIAEMLGVPAESRGRFHRWSRGIVEAGWTRWGMVRAIPNAWFFLRYVRGLIAVRRREPRDDLLSALIDAEEEGQKLGQDELVAMVFLLLVAGHETTVNLIGNGVLALLRNPAQMERLRGDPGLIVSAVEELLRYESPVETGTERFAAEDVAIGGAVIPRGSLVLAALASANRDERQFPDPDRLDLSRDPNRHLAFGLGLHYCLGAPLARLEGQIAIRTLLDRFETLRLAVPEAVRWRRGLVLRGVEELPLVFTPIRPSAPIRRGNGTRHGS
jgi:cytochrome P450